MLLDDDAEAKQDHLVRPADAQKIYTSLSKATEKFPKWNGKRDMTPKTYLDRLEGELLLTETPDKEWFKALSMVIPDSDETTRHWVTENIVKPKLCWTDVRKIFIARFRRHDEDANLQRKYDECVQGKETLLTYANNFISLCIELGNDQNSRTVISHFENGLHKALQDRYRDKVGEKSFDNENFRIRNVDEALRMARWIVPVLLLNTTNQHHQVGTRSEIFIVPTTQTLPTIHSKIVTLRSNDWLVVHVIELPLRNLNPNLLPLVLGKIYQRWNVLLVNKWDIMLINVPTKIKRLLLVDHLLLSNLH